MKEMSLVQKRTVTNSEGSDYEGSDDDDEFVPWNGRYTLLCSFYTLLKNLCLKRQTHTPLFILWTLMTSWPLWPLRPITTFHDTLCPICPMPIMPYANYALCQLCPLCSMLYVHYAYYIYFPRTFIFSLFIYPHPSPWKPGTVSFYQFCPDVILQICFISMDRIFLYI